MWNFVLEGCREVQGSELKKDEIDLMVCHCQLLFQVMVLNHLLENLVGFLIKMSDVDIYMDLDYLLHGFGVFA